MYWNGFFDGFGLCTILTLLFLLTAFYLENKELRKDKDP